MLHLCVTEYCYTKFNLAECEEQGAEVVALGRVAQPLLALLHCHHTLQHRQGGRKSVDANARCSSRALIFLLQRAQQGGNNLSISRLLCSKHRRRRRRLKPSPSMPTRTTGRSGTKDEGGADMQQW